MLEQTVSWFLKRLCRRSHCIEHNLFSPRSYLFTGTLFPSFNIHMNNMDERVTKADATVERCGATASLAEATGELGETLLLFCVQNTFA